MLIYYFFIFVLGLIFGSFLTSLTYRIMHGELLPKGRSYCPRCKRKIMWYDNIPLLSYVLLQGKCRTCKNKISIRYPLIEFITGAVFVLVANLKTQSMISNLDLKTWTLPFLLLISFLLIAVFITDFEHQIIPDEISLLLFVISFLVVLGVSSETLYLRLLTGFLGAAFLLMLNLVTLGRGMGLGDVKLALSIGILLGWPYTISWFFVSFVLGAIIGVIFLAAGQAKLGKTIAFGPFLIIAFFIVLFFGDTLTGVLMPYL